MHLSSLSRPLIVTALCVLSWSTAVMAAPALSVTPPGDSSNTFTVQGSGMDGVAGIQLDIAYDAASLATPTVTQGALVTGAMMAANTTLPGHIKIAIISTKPFSGSGQIVAITFASKTGSGGITLNTTSLIDSNGASFASSTSNSPAVTAATPGTISTPGVPFSQTPQAQTTAGAPPPAAASTPTYLGTVTLPADQQQQADSQPATATTAPVNTGEPAAAKIAEQTQPSGKPAADSKPEETPQYVVYKGILDRFKQYNGSKSLAAVTALFDKKVAQTIHQEPAILLSDGQNKATLTVDIPARISSSPNFAVNGGSLVSFKQDKQIKGRWTVEVLPEAGSVKVLVTIITGAEEFDFPLTVAPPVKTALTLDERGWDRFIKEVGTAAAPLHDLNNDGVRDYMDEYIFVANYLARKSIPAKPAATTKKPAK